jgi:hypothetical protein
MCLHGDNNESCTHPSCQVFNTSQSISHLQPPTQAIYEALISALLMRTPILSSLCVQTKTLADKTEALISLSLPRSPVKPPEELPFFHQKTYTKRICLTSQAQLQVYKEKGFALSMDVKDELDQRVSVRELFRVKLYTCESPPKLLKVNISLRKILRGTLESVMSEEGVVNFQNIVINEVSSHYVKECFILVIECECLEVKPLVIENLYVRARNFHKKGKSE